MGSVILNPVVWSVEHVAHAFGGPTTDADTTQGAIPLPNRIGAADLRAALAQGLDDFLAFRTDVIFLGVMYAVVGLVLGELAQGEHLPQMVFPLAAGFALLGPFLSTGLYEMSRRREMGRQVSLANSFGAFRSPAIIPILTLGLGLVAIFAAWLASAQLIYHLTLGPRAAASMAVFAHDLFATSRGLLLIVAGIGTGFLFAVITLSISVISFPLMLDRHVGPVAAIATSWRVTRANPRMIALWGLIVAGALVLGSIPLLIGLAVVMPVLGHATWHLYRRILPVGG